VYRQRVWHLAIDTGGRIAPRLSLLVETAIGLMDLSNEQYLTSTLTLQNGLVDGVHGSAHRQFRRGLIADAGKSADAQRAWHGQLVKFLEDMGTNLSWPK